MSSYAARTRVAVCSTLQETGETGNRVEFLEELEKTVALDAWKH